MTTLWGKQKQEKGKNINESEPKRDNLICLFAVIFLHTLWQIYGINKYEKNELELERKFACKLSAKCAFQIDLRYERLELLLLPHVASGRHPIEFQMPKMQGNRICILHLNISIFVSLELPALNCNRTLVYILICWLFYFVTNFMDDEMSFDLRAQLQRWQFLGGQWVWLVTN